MTDFIDFLKTKQDEVKQQESLNKQRVEDWLHALTAFYQQVRGWLELATNQGLLEIVQDSIYVDELGGYLAPRLCINVGADEVFLEPVGTVIIGAQGRVDMIVNGTVRVFILDDLKERQWWYADRVFPRDVTYKELDAKLFTNLLQTSLS